MAEDTFHSLIVIYALLFLFQYHDYHSTGINHIFHYKLDVGPSCAWQALGGKCAKQVTVVNPLRSFASIPIPVIGTEYVQGRSSRVEAISQVYFHLPWNSNTCMTHA